MKITILIGMSTNKTAFLVCDSRMTKGNSYVDEIPKLMNIPRLNCSLITAGAVLSHRSDSTNTIKLGIELIEILSRKSNFVAARR